MTETKTQSKANKPDTSHEYSKGLKNVQEAEKSYSESLQTLSDAVKKGIDSYIEERDKSANSKKDGAVEDLFINSAKGVSVAAEAGSSAIYDVAKSIDSYLLTDRQRKDLKRSIRAFSSFKTPFPVAIPFFTTGYDDDEDEDDD